MNAIFKTDRDRLAELAGDRIWPLVHRYGTHSEPVKRALRSWGSIWEGVTNSDEGVQGPEASSPRVLSDMAEQSGGDPSVGEPAGELPGGSTSDDQGIETEGTVK